VIDVDIDSFYRPTDGRRLSQPR